MRQLLPAFISSTSFDESGLATCLGLGIHPVAPGLRPVPVLADSALRMKVEIRNGSPLAPETVDQFDEFCIRLNRLSFDLRETWLTNRCGFLSEDAIIVRAIESIQSLAPSRQIRQLIKVPITSGTVALIQPAYHHSWHFSFCLVGLPPYRQYLIVLHG